MNEYNYKDFRIEIFNDRDYPYVSKGGERTAKYAKHYLEHEGDYKPNAIHGVKIYRDEEEIDSCVLTASGGGTGISENSTLLDGDRLIVCCSNKLFSLTLPDLDLAWAVEADWATCFQVYKVGEDYLTHGELQIARINREGIVLWTFGGADIFVNMDGEPSFQFATDQILLRDSDGQPHLVEREYILLTDFNGQQYRVGFDGVEITEYGK